MSSKNIDSVGKKCCGCGVCNFVCPEGAIFFHRGQRGEYLYKANERCIHCGKCLAVCAANNASVHTAPSFFIKAITKQPDVLKKSSSGGVAYEFARHVLNREGIVYAATWNKDKQVVQHSRIADIKDLPAMQGSKYVHSTINKDTYGSIVGDVAKRKVLVIGCPCQVSAVKNTVGQNENLLCIDLLCHGVPSAEMLSRQLESITEAPVESISFRQGVNYVLNIKNTKETSFSINGYDNPYYVLFLNHTSLRESCFSCIYAQKRRVGDITVGDYVEDGKRYSCVFTNSYLGERIVIETSPFVEYEKRAIDLVRDKDALQQSMRRHSRVDIFTKRYNKHGINTAYYLTFPDYVLKRFGRKILGDNVYEHLVSCIKRK